MSPVAPKPLMEDFASLVGAEGADLARALAAKSVPLPSMAEDSVARVPRNVLRFQRSRSLILSASLPSVHDGGGAIDFYQRLAWKRGDGNTGASWATVGKIGFKDFVQAVVIVDLGKKIGELQNTFHGA